MLKWKDGASHKGAAAWLEQRGLWGWSLRWTGPRAHHSSRLSPARLGRWPWWWFSPGWLLEGTWSERAQYGSHCPPFASNLCWLQAPPPAHQMLPLLFGWPFNYAQLPNLDLFNSSTPWSEPDDMPTHHILMSTAVTLERALCHMAFLHWLKPLKLRILRDHYIC